MRRWERVPPTPGGGLAGSPGAQPVGSFDDAADGVPARHTGRRPWLHLGRGRGRSRSAPSATAVLGEVVGALRVGAAPVAAWARVRVRIAADGAPDPADLGAATGLPEHHVAAVVAACRLAGELGAPPAALLEQVTVAVGRDADAAGRRSAALAGPRATARLLGWLPVAGLGIGASLGADPLRLLLGGGVGTVLLVLGGLLVAAGHAWTGRELRRAEADGRDA